MEKGLSKTWTPEAEELWVSRLRSCRTFAEQHLTMTIRDLLKYDGRSKESKRAIAQARLRLAVATDEDLKKLVELQMRLATERLGEIPGLHRASLEVERLGDLKNIRDEIREKGIKRSELRCQ